MCTLFHLQVQEGNKEDVDKAVEAARAAMKRNSPWRKMSPANRGKILGKLADIIERDSAFIASVEVTDNGKPFMMALYDIFGCINMFRFAWQIFAIINSRTRKGLNL